MQVTYSKDSRTVTVRELSDDHKLGAWYPPVDFPVRNIQRSGPILTDRHGTDAYTYVVELSREFEKITKLTSATYYIEPHVVLEDDFLRRFSDAVHKTSRLSMSDGTIPVSEHMRLIKARIHQASSSVLDDLWVPVSGNKKVKHQVFRHSETIIGPDHPAIDMVINMDIVWDPLSTRHDEVSVIEPQHGSLSKDRNADTPSVDGV